MIVVLVFVCLLLSVRFRRMLRTHYLCNGQLQSHFYRCFKCKLEIIKFLKQHFGYFITFICFYLLCKNDFVYPHVTIIIFIGICDNFYTNLLLLIIVCCDKFSWYYTLYNVKEKDNVLIRKFLSG